MLLAFWLGNALRATTACTFSTSQLPKVLRTWSALYILTWKCASRRNTVHFFNISTSKSTFDFEMCFARQRRTLFRHLNCQKCSMWGVLVFSLPNVLRATTACNFSSLIPPDGSAPAALASQLFDPPEPQIVAKTECFATFLLFRAPATSFFWLFLLTLSLLWSSLIFSDRLSSFLFYSLFFSSLLFSSLLFSSLLFSDSSHLCCSSVHMVGSLTSKLPSVIIYIYIFTCAFGISYGVLEVDFIWLNDTFFLYSLSVYRSILQREREIYIYTYNRWFIVSWFHTVTPLDLFYREAAAMVRIALIAWDHSGEMQCHKPTRGW